jgi:hypothetical protein
VAETELIRMQYQITEALTDHTDLVRQQLAPGTMESTLCFNEMAQGPQFVTLLADLREAGCRRSLDTVEKSWISVDDRSVRAPQLKLCWMK